MGTATGAKAAKARTGLAPVPESWVRAEALPARTGEPRTGGSVPGAAAGPGLGELRPPGVSPLPPAQQSHGAATSAIAELTLQGNKKNNPEMSQAAPKSRSHPSPGAAPGRHAVPGSSWAPGLGCGGAGAGQLKTTYSIYFLNTCSFMKTITLARSKHIQTNLLYDTRGCQRNGEKPLLIHSAVPAQPRRGERLNSSCRSWERGWGYLAVIFIHISAFGNKNKRLLPNQQANLTGGGRHLPAALAVHPGASRARAGPGHSPFPTAALGCWGGSGHAVAAPRPLPAWPRQGWDSEGQQGRDGPGRVLRGAGGEEVLYLIVSLILKSWS